MRQPSSRIPSARATRFWGVLATLIALALHATLLWIAWWPAPRGLVGDEAYYLGTAREILRSADATAPPLWPPLYPRLLAGLLGLGGEPLIPVAQTAMLVAAALILGDLSARVNGSPDAGRLTTWLVLLYPPLAAFTGYLWPEITHLLLFSAALWVLIARRDRWCWLLVLGVLLGLAISAKYLLWPLVALLLAIAAVSKRRIAAAWVAAGLGAALWTVSLAGAPRAEPWLDRASTSPIFNLWVGFNDRSRKDNVETVVDAEYWRYQASRGTLAERNARLLEWTRALAEQRGWTGVLGRQLRLQYFRLLDRDSILTDLLPGGALHRRGGYRAPPPLVREALRWTSYLLYSALLVAAAFGLATWRGVDRAWLWAGLVFVGYCLAIFLFLHVKSRYRLQLLPFAFCWASRALVLGARRVGILERDAPDTGPVSRSAWSASAALSALLLFLAWCGPLLDAWGAGDRIGPG